MCRLSFLHPPDHPDSRHTDWSKLPAHLEDEITFSRKSHNLVAIDTCVERRCGANLEGCVFSTPKSRPRGDPLSPITAGIQEDIGLKNWLSGSGG
jgi:hypothetical protein